MLEFKNVTRLYTSNKGIKDCSWIVKEGVVGILGNNGCGKTTTFKIILGLEEYDGKVLYENKDIHLYSKRIFGYVPEERTLYQDCYVNDLLYMLARIKGFDEKEAQTRIDEHLRYFKIYSYKHKKVSELSKGNQQVLQIICGVMHNPKILILDEPFNGLDRNKLKLVIEYIRNRKLITLISFHQSELVSKVCDQVIYLNDGIIYEVLEVAHD